MHHNSFPAEDLFPVLATYEVIPAYTKVDLTLEFFLLSEHFCYWNAMVYTLVFCNIDNR